MLREGDLELRAMTPDDLPAMYEWSIDAATNFLNGGVPLLPVTWERFRDKWSERPSGPDAEDFTVAVDGIQVGFCQLTLFDHLARSAMIGITLAPSVRGQHVGRRAVALLLRHAFVDRGLHRVWLGTLATNEPALRAYRAVGFVEETRGREISWIDGRYVDGIRMGLLRSEWELANAVG